MTNTQCINACTDDKNKPRPARHGLLCARCAQRLDEMLRDIIVDYAHLPLMTIATGAGDDSGIRAKNHEAPAPGRLEVMALTEPTERGRVARPAGDELWYEESPDLPAAVPVIHTWANELRDVVAALRNETA